MGQLSGQTSLSSSPYYCIWDNSKQQMSYHQLVNDKEKGEKEECGL
jgi:hypothetical protein